jgi:hypothetical protein
MELGLPSKGKELKVLVNKVLRMLGARRQKVTKG